MPTILDFQITPNAKNNLILEIFERDKTQLLAKTTFDYDLSYLTGYEISGLDFDAKDPAARLERIKNFGGKLYQKLFSPEIEKIWQRYSNKYESVIAGSTEARRVIEAIRDGKIEITEDPYLYALKRILTVEPAEKKSAKKKTDDAAS